MSNPARASIPEDHPARLLFQELSERGLGQIDIRDPASVTYVARMMTEFMHIDAVYPSREDCVLVYLTDLIAAAQDARDPDLKRARFQHLGDLTLFMLGLFPERFHRSRRPLDRSFYAAEGRRSYRIVADLVPSGRDLTVFRRLSSEYDRYVAGLRWVRLYIRDPFFQYMFSQFGIR